MAEPMTYYKFVHIAPVGGDIL